MAVCASSVEPDKKRSANADVLETYTAANHNHVGRWFCTPGSGDRCDITAALRVAADRLRDLQEKP